LNPWQDFGMAAASLIPELEDVIQRGSADRRAETLRRVTDLFLESASTFSEELVELFDDVLSRLIVEIETRALAELARRLAPVSNAPIRVMRRLARDDDIAVAGPVLLRSERLDEMDLVEIARTKSQAHLLAISSRARVDTAVTDVLVGRGDGDVVRSVANNPGAKFSEAGFAVLVKRAEKDGVLAEKVGRREDIPPHLFRRLLMQATEVVQKRLLATAKPETQAEIKRVLAKVSQEVGEAAAPRDYVAAQRLVMQLHQTGRLDERQLLDFARSGRYEETVASLSALCGVPVDVVDRLMTGERADPILILCKAVGLEWTTVRALILIRHAGRRLSPQSIDDALGNFERLSLSTAERVLRFWQVRQPNE
jgi:uncharacterized protein (DUF2336 family)